MPRLLSKAVRYVSMQRGDFTYTSSDGFTFAPNDFPTFDYTVSDGQLSDDATATIDFSPDAVDDNNYILYKTNDSDNDGIEESVRARVRGNILSRGSSGDNADSSPDGTVTLQKIYFDNNDGNPDNDEYIFDIDNTSHNIEYWVDGVLVGTLSIQNTGLYTFTLNSGVDVDNIPSSLEFTYTIQDGDTNNPETDDATLTIYLTQGASTTSNSAVTLLDDNDELIDLSYDEENFDVVIGDEDSLSTSDLSDLFADENSESLDDYITFNDDKENAVENSVDDNELVLVAVEQRGAELDVELTITNGFLAEGATLQSDAAVENAPQHAELDTNDIL